MFTYYASLHRKTVGLVAPIRGMNQALNALREFERNDLPCSEFVNYLSRIIESARGKVVQNYTRSNHRLIITSKQVELWKGDEHIVSYTLEEALKVDRINLLLDRLGEDSYTAMEVSALIEQLAGKDVKVDLSF